ncbi:MAG: hypothetical protein RBS80_14205 [Thermoguttaceae bacterium]|jgi:hypothetical protein|nr:hypothetical protein [Thermoguttaceae bacterium]
MNASCLLRILPVLLCFAYGCGPSGPATYRVSGTVTYQGEPLPLGIVMFVPEQGPSSTPAAIDQQGRYQHEAVAGEHRVAVVAMPPREGGRPDPTIEDGFDYTGVPEVKSLIPAKYNRHDTSNISVSVEAKQQNQIDIVLQ